MNLSLIQLYMPCWVFYPSSTHIGFHFYFFYLHKSDNTATATIQYCHPAASPAKTGRSRCGTSIDTRRARVPPCRRKRQWASRSQECLGNQKIEKFRRSTRGDRDRQSAALPISCDGGGKKMKSVMASEAVAEGNWRLWRRSDQKELQSWRWEMREWYQFCCSEWSYPGREFYPPLPACQWSLGVCDAPAWRRTGRQVGPVDTVLNYWGR